MWYKYLYLLCGFISFIWVRVAFKKNAPLLLMLFAFMGGFISLGVIIFGYLHVNSEQNGKSKKD